MMVACMQWYLFYLCFQISKTVKLGGERQGVGVYGEMIRKGLLGGGGGLWGNY